MCFDVILIENIRTKEERNLHSKLQQILIKHHACVEILHAVDLRYNISSENVPVLREIPEPDCFPTTKY